MAASFPRPLRPAQASYLARPLRSSIPGRLPCTSPSVACLKSEYSSSSVSLDGRVESVFTRSCAERKSSASAMSVSPLLRQFRQPEREGLRGHHRRQPPAQRLSAQVPEGVQQPEGLEHLAHRALAVP